MEEKEIVAQEEQLNEKELVLSHENVVHFIQIIDSSKLLMIYDSLEER